jgi:hypothetical protein
MKSTSKKSSTEKALDEMELKPDDLLVAIDNFNRNHETQSVLIKDINDLNQVNFELSKNWETLNKNESKNKYIEITKNENRIAEKEAQLRSVKGHGYSPEKRFLEAAEILEKEGSSSPRYLWRKAVLKAEIKYGKYLNKIQDNTESGYSELIEALKKKS